ncbi:MAG: tetratricopeptide repeat protein [Myxococcota bacterium]
MRASFVFLAVAMLAACVSPQRVARSEAKLELGAAYYREGDVEGALATLREAVRLDPRAWKPLNALGVVYIARGEHALAEESFQRALRLAPDEAEILNNYGTLLVDLGRNEEAVARFQAALKDLDYRNMSMVHSNLAFALLQTGRLDEALRHAREATRRAPTLCRAWYNLGRVMEAKKDAPAALEAYSEVARICPDESTGALIRVGCLHVQTGSVEEGSGILRDVVARHPGTSYADEARACLRTSGN